uniref:Protein krueppel n=1 Tax=Glossina pallidipes TaxID=7398 RepID=A0A1A9ZJM8_GLOPL
MESYLPSTQSKSANNKCRTCIKAKVSRYSLYQRISLDTELSKTYGELLSCLLRNNASDKEETFMPQRLCVKCANLLKNIYVFLLEAEKLHEIYLNRARSLKIVIKNEECLQELPIDLPQAPETSVDIKTEPSEIHVGVGTEPQLTKCLSSFDGLRDKKNHEQLAENVKKETNQNEEYFLNNLNLRHDHDEDAKSSNGLEEQTTGDPYKGKKIYIKSIDQDTNKEIIYNRPAFQQHVAVRCELCDKIYKNSKTLAAHKFYTHMDDEEKLRCALCDFKTSRIACLKIHMTTIHGPEFAEKSIKPKNERIRNFGCHLCSKKYCRKEDLQKHVKEKHSNDSKTQTQELQTEVGKSKDFYLCNFCGQSFTTHSNLQMHSRKHTGERPYKCDLCEKAFIRQQDMKLHRVIHSDEKPHQCFECGKSFKRSDKLRDHRRVHSELRPYKCTECNKSFKHASVLRTHMRIHTGQKPFSCKTCEETFSLRISLNTHCLKNDHKK